MSVFQLVKYLEKYSETKGLCPTPFPQMSKLIFADNSVPGSLRANLRNMRSRWLRLWFLLWLILSSGSKFFARQNGYNLYRTQRNQLMFYVNSGLQFHRCRSQKPEYYKAYVLHLGCCGYKRRGLVEILTCLPSQSWVGVAAISSQFLCMLDWKIQKMVSNKT